VADSWAIPDRPDSLPIMRAIVPVWMCLLSAMPATAAPSLCGHLPTSGKVARAGPEDTVPARPRADRVLGCPPGFALDLSARPAACRRAGSITADGNPRAACLASLALGPVADVPAQNRPTRSCPSGTITAVVRLEGVNVGLADVALFTRSPGVTVVTLDEEAKPPGAGPLPSAQGCFAHQCRLIRLTAASDALDAARLELAIAGGESLVVPVPLKRHCDDPSARPPMAGLRRTTVDAPKP
jgi:hypothetical protein